MPRELSAFLAAVLVWAISAVFIGDQVASVIGHEQPPLTALVLVVGVLGCACAPAFIVFQLSY